MKWKVFDQPAVARDHLASRSDRPLSIRTETCSTLAPRATGTGHAQHFLDLGRPEVGDPSAGESR